jgi:hypothetical protein
VTAPNDGSDADIRISDFGFPSDFGFRISDFPPAFGFRISLRPSDFGLPQLRPPAGAVRIAFLLLLGLACWSSSAATLVPRAPTGSDPTLLQCGNLIYAGNRSSVCFADRFLTDVVDQTCLRVNRKFCPVRLDGEGVFDFPFCVMSGNESFSLSEKERNQVRKFLAQGGFLLASPGCSDEKWDRSFRQEIKVCFPDNALKRIPMTHPIFSIVNQIPRLTDKHGRPVALEGLELNGRLVLVYSREGLNDVEHAIGCCCCGGNEISNPVRVNVNVFTYAVVY